MLNQTNVRLGNRRSCIRELFEYGKARSAEIGGQNVFDFSIGNPGIPTPACVTEALKEIIEQTDPVLLHGYTSAQGDYGVRGALADCVNSRSGTNLSADNFYLTCGAAASLTITLHALLNEGEEVIVLAPFFPEYRVFIQNAGGRTVVVNTLPNTFRIDFCALEGAITANTRAVIINSPNNPTGVVYSAEEISRLAVMLKRLSQKFGEPIFLISDEPYRELVYDSNVRVPCVMNYYAHSIICYSYSKSLSLPGERIGYVAVNNLMEEWKEVYAAVCGAGRALGFVCAPALFQQLIKRVCNKTSDFSVYKRNRDILYNALCEYGFSVVKPEGAFYMFVKSPEEASAFSERAKRYELLVVPAEDFGTKGYVRLSYCGSTEMIKRSLPAFRALAASYNLIGRGGNGNM